MRKQVKLSTQARFDTKLTRIQKEFFEYAASIGGFRTLTDFVITSAEEKAKKIIDQHEAFLISEKDKEIFFNALMHPKGPNKKLVAAAKR